MDAQKIRVGFFFGGRSVEHEVSVISALQAIAALDQERYAPIPLYISKAGQFFTGEGLLDIENFRDLPSLLKASQEVYLPPRYEDGRLLIEKPGWFGKPEVGAIDVAFPIMHGTFGEDGTLQGLLELIGLPYVGCNVLASATGMDKVAFKLLLRESGLPVTDYVWLFARDGQLRRQHWLDTIEQRLSYPLIVKPANLGSSVGIRFADDRDALDDALNHASRFAARLLVEPAISPLREINCSVLGDYEECQASECEEPLREGDFLSFEDKYVDGGGKGSAKGRSTSQSQGMQTLKRQLPADIPPALRDRIQGLAQETFRAIGASGVARIDFLLNADTEAVFVNEINTIPGSLSFYLWEASGLSFPELTDRLIQLAFKAHREKANLELNSEVNLFSLGAGAKGAKQKKP